MTSSGGIECVEIAFRGAVREATRTLSWVYGAVSCTILRAEFGGQVVGGAKGVRVLLAQYPAAAFQRVLVQVQGGLHLTKLAQVRGQVVGGVQGVGVILAQYPAA